MSRLRLTQRAFTLLEVIVVVAILVICTLSLAKTYIGHDVTDEQNELNGIIFLVLLLFFVCLLLLFVRFSVLFLRRHVRDGASSVRSSHSACGGESGVRAEPATSAPRVAAPPPYHEALLLPAPLAESPPPSYDKLPELIRG